MTFSNYAPPPPSLRGVRFILVDDQTEVAAALAASLTHYAQMVCVGVFAEGQRALAHLKREPVDLVLLDLLMPAMPGVEFLRRLKKQAGAAVPPVLVLTCDDSDRAVAEVLGWGADGFLVKGTGIEALTRALANLREGGAVLSPHLTRRLIQRAYDTPPPGLTQDEQLTPREQNMLDYMSRGLSYTEIAQHEGISPETVRTHARRIFRKLGVHSRSAAVALRWREAQAEGNTRPGV
jgi:DNA-binding NarL/FixJ family response regulator